MTAPRSLGAVRAALAAVAAFVLCAAMLAGAVGTNDPGALPADAGPVSSAPSLQEAADIRQFSPGNIISDAVFYDGSAMTAVQVQNFITTKNPNCKAGAKPCLKNYREKTRTRAADNRCNGYQGAASESAATIVYKVGVSCGISQRALLVMLQKEQGLITASGSDITSRRYQIAMGYGCPDTAACDTLYYGFANQLYSAARQFKNYAANPQNYAHQPGKTNNVRWSPKASCGSSPVLIQNKATAGLYNYTPYQPNGAALRGGYGLGDSCSAYGNRNFWLYYNDWFGSTQSAGGSAIVARAALADAAKIGLATSGTSCGLAERGCFRAHQNGAIYWSPDTGAYLVWGAIHARWAQLGWEKSRLGYPTRDESCFLPGGGCFQEFQNGAVYWSPATGAHPVLGSIQKKWASTAWETGPLGYPTAAEACGLAGKGCVQAFQNGHVYWSSASGAHLVMPGAIRDLWWAKGGESSSLGYPTGEQQCGLPDSGCTQSFLTGAIYTSASQPIRFVSGAVATKYAATKAHAGGLGHPMSNTVCGLRDSGCFQEFERGAIYSSKSSGARTVLTGAIRTAWSAQRWESGPLGYPTTDQRCAGWGCAQQFTGGAIYVTKANGTQIVKGELYKGWTAMKREQGPLGFPTSGAVCGLARSGCFQEFQKGSIYWTPGTGAQRISGKILQAWGAQGWERGTLGYPTSAPVASAKGITQRFQGGTLVQGSNGKVTRK